MRLDQFFFGSRSSPLDPFVSSNLLVDMGRRCTIVLQADPEYFCDFRRVLALGQTGAKYAFLDRLDIQLHGFFCSLMLCARWISNLRSPLVVETPWWDTLIQSRWPERVLTLTSRFDNSPVGSLRIQQSPRLHRSISSYCSGQMNHFSGSQTCVVIGIVWFFAAVAAGS